MKIIENEYLVDVKVEEFFVLDQLWIHQNNDCIKIDKQGAKQLLEVLQEFVNDLTRD